MKSFPPEKVMDIYMNSLMKSQVDFSYVVRHLYQPKENYEDLTKVYDKHVLRGKLVLPLANGETSYNALKRLLKYFIGFRGEMKHAPLPVTF